MGIPHAQGIFQWIEPDVRQVIYQRTPFYVLLERHVLVVGVAAVVTISLGVGAGIAVTRRKGQDLFAVSVATCGSLGQTFPPVAVLALAVPVLGFGTLPIIVALMLYGLFARLYAIPWQGFRMLIRTLKPQPVQWG